jgi:hypothetical protein
MKTVFTGDLKNFEAPAVGQNVLKFLLEEAKRAEKVVERPLTVSVAGKTIMATGRYDPKSDTLTVEGYLD